MADPIELEHHPSAPINDRLLMFKFKVMPCQLQSCKGPDNCVYLHPGEKGRRDPQQSCYDLIPCASYRQNGGSCPDGDSCRYAHGLLELRFHPRAYYYATRLKFKDLEAYLTGTKILPGERAAIQLILHLMSNGCIRGYELPNDTKSATAIDEEATAIDEETIEHQARARSAGTAIIKRYGYGNTLTLNKNGQLSSFSGGSSCKIPEEDGSVAVSSIDECLEDGGVAVTSIDECLEDGGVAVTSKDECLEDGGVAITAIDEWVEPPWIADLLSDVDASPTAAGSIVPSVDATQACVHPDCFLDSGASAHVVGVDITLHNYRRLAEPMSVTVADGYELRVLGTGSIISECGNFIIHNVHRVEGIQINLISVAQLDMGHNLFCGFGDRRCKVKNHEDLIGGGYLVGDGLYRLSFLQVP